MAGEACPFAQGRDEQERGEDGVVEEHRRDGPGLVLVVVRGNKRAVDAQLEAPGQGVRAEFGQ